MKENQPTRESIATIILNRLNEAAARSEELAIRLSDKLTPVMQDRPEEDKEDKPEAEYPPLFTDMRARLEDIERSLDIISKVIDRTEI